MKNSKGNQLTKVLLEKTCHLCCWRWLSYGAVVSGKFVFVGNYELVSLQAFFLCHLVLGYWHRRTFTSPVVNKEKMKPLGDVQNRCFEFLSSSFGIVLFVNCNTRVEIGPAVYTRTENFHFQ